MGNSPYILSGPNSRYASPASSQWGGEMYHGQPAQMMPYGTFASPIPMHAQPHYASPPYAHRGVSTPPTSSHSQDDGSVTRKGRSKVSKRKNKPNADKPNVPELAAPLSECTANLACPVRDMQAWVNRPAEDRQKEAEKRKGQIARPMNSFMLYRSAYAERTKAWCTQNNHQIVSAVSGKSWPLESKEIRAFYNELAQTERDNHQKAFPGYKFSPSKTNVASQRKRKAGDDEGEESSILDDDDGDYRPSGNRKRARPSNRAETPELNYPPYGYTSAPGPMPYRLPGQEQQINMSHFNSSNPGKMAPEPLGQTYDHYFEMQQYPAHQMPGTIQDIRYMQSQHPAMTQHHSVVGLPGGAHADFLDEQWRDPAPAEHHIDPMLMSELDHSFMAPGHFHRAGAFSEQGFRELEGDLVEGHFDGHLATSITYGPPSSGSGQGGLMGFPPQTIEEEQEEEFSRIMYDGTQEQVA